MHERGAVICSACSGIFLLAETGLFDGRDATVLRRHFSVANPVDEMIKRSRLERTFKRRFVTATGLTPIAYVQRLRIEDAKRRLERTDAPVDEISWHVGYEDPAFFRRLFKRITGVAPGAYRKRFRVPEFTPSNQDGHGSTKPARERQP